MPEGNGVIILSGKDERRGADLMDFIVYGVDGIFRTKPIEQERSARRLTIDDGTQSAAGEVRRRSPLSQLFGTDTGFHEELSKISSTLPLS